MIHIIYASTMGHTETIVEKVAEYLSAEGFETQLHKAQHTSYSLIQKNDTFIFATSTWGHGELNPYFKDIYEKLDKEKDLSSKKAAIIGSGNVKYEPDYFCEGAKTLRQAWLDANGQELTSPFYLDGLPYDKLDTLVKMWTARLIKKLQV